MSAQQSMLIGLLGGMSWQSTAIYYRLMNQYVQTKQGGQHSARVLLHSVDFEETHRRQHANDWAGCADILVRAAQGLVAGGASFLVLASNTMHKVADEIEEGSGRPLLHIADPTGDKLRNEGFRKVGLLGTRFTMEEPFYKNRLLTRFGLETITLSETTNGQTHNIIYQELCKGTVTSEARGHFRAAIDELRDLGAQAVILGCTELTMAVEPTQVSLPVFDTTKLHVRAAINLALASPGE